MNSRLAPVTFGPRARALETKPGPAATRIRAYQPDRASRKYRRTRRPPSRNKPALAAGPQRLGLDKPRSISADHRVAGPIGGVVPADRPLLTCPVGGDNRDTAGRPHSRSERVCRRSAPRPALDEERKARAAASPPLRAISASHVGLTRDASSSSAASVRPMRSRRSHLAQGGASSRRGGASRMKRVYYPSPAAPAPPRSANGGDTGHRDVEGQPRGGAEGPSPLRGL
jgi:hypothetical protein